MISYWLSLSFLSIFIGKWHSKRCSRLNSKCLWTTVVNRSKATRFRWIQTSGQFDSDNSWALTHVYIGDECDRSCAGHGRCSHGACMSVFISILTISVIPKRKLQFLGHQISWVIEWVCMRFFSRAGSAVGAAKETKFGTTVAWEVGIMPERRIHAQRRESAWYHTQRWKMHRNMCHPC